MSFTRDGHSFTALVYIFAVLGEFLRLNLLSMNYVTSNQILPAVLAVRIQIRYSRHVSGSYCSGTAAARSGYVAQIPVTDVAKKLQLRRGRRLRCGALERMVSSWPMPALQFLFCLVHNPGRRYLVHIASPELFIHN